MSPKSLNVYSKRDRKKEERENSPNSSDLSSLLIWTKYILWIFPVKKGNQYFTYSYFDLLLFINNEKKKVRNIMIHHHQINFFQSTNAIFIIIFVRAENKKSFQHILSSYRIFIYLIKWIFYTIIGKQH